MYLAGYIGGAIDVGAMYIEDLGTASAAFSHCEGYKAARIAVQSWGQETLTM